MLVQESHDKMKLSESSIRKTISSQATSCLYPITSWHTDLLTQPLVSQALKPPCSHSAPKIRLWGTATSTMAARPSAIKPSDQKFPFHRYIPILQLHPHHHRHCSHSRGRFSSNGKHLPSEAHKTHKTSLLAGFKHKSLFVLFTTLSALFLTFFFTPD